MTGGCILVTVLMLAAGSGEKTNLSTAKTRPDSLLLDINFSNMDTVCTTNGINGKALDLSAGAPIRRSLDFPVSRKGEYLGFSITIWTKAAEGSSEEYTIASSETRETASGWQIGVSREGSWFFKANFKNETYSYKTTVPRQNIRDGRWHLLAVTYSPGKRELGFSFDGVPVAVYLADSSLDFFEHNNLTLGASRRSRNYRQFWSFPYTTKPFYTTWDSFNGLIGDTRVYNKTLSRHEIAQYYSFVADTELKESLPVNQDLLSVTTHNIKHGGNVFGTETGKHHLLDVLRKLESDVYVLVETEGSGPFIADHLGYQLYLAGSDETANLSILSRYPISATYPLSDPFIAGGIRVVIPGGKHVNIFSICLDWQPAYFFYSFDNNRGWSLDRFLAEDDKTRGEQIRNILHEISPCTTQADTIPLIMAGDFDSGSHLDYTREAGHLHRGYIVDWNVSRVMEKAGFRDSFRELYPDPSENPGITFSTAFEVWMNDRIDYIYYKGADILATASALEDKHPVQFPSDHAALQTKFRLHDSHK